MIKLIVYFSLMASLHGSPIEKDFFAEKLSVISVKDFSKKLSSLDLEDAEKSLIARQVVESQRVDLMFYGVGKTKIWSELSQAIQTLPATPVKADLISKILMADKPTWGEEPGVSKGARFKEIGELCRETLNHYLPDDPVDWSELANTNARKNLANVLNQVLSGEKNLPKRDKSLYAALPSHEPSTGNSIGFEEGWEEKEDKSSRSSSSQKHKSEPVQISKKLPRVEGGALGKDVSKGGSRLPWLIVGVLIVGILALLLMWKGKATS